MALDEPGLVHLKDWETRHNFATIRMQTHWRNRKQKTIEHLKFRRFLKTKGTTTVHARGDSQSTDNTKEQPIK